MIKISVVTVTFNCKDTIELTIQSIINQTYKPTEYIIIDGGSIDGTVKIIEKYSNQISFWKSEKDKGIFDAMNKSLDHITGKYVIFINAGDRLISNNILSNIFDGKEYNEDLIFGDIFIQNKLGYLFIKSNPIYSSNATIRDYVFKGQGICHQALFTKSDILKKVKFNVHFKLGADYDTTAKVFLHGNKELNYVGFPISIFDDRNGGASHYQIKKVLYERREMFNYSKGIKFYSKVLSEVINYYLKSFIGIIFAPVILKYRRKKYLPQVN